MIGRKKTTRNIRIDISYDGSNYHGWQRQKGQVTIQEVLENAVSKMTREKINLLGSGRTDAGVHAICQVANFLTSSKIPIDGFEKGLNSLLPEDVAIISAKEVPLQFHARKSAKSKTYRYRIVESDKRLALVHRRAWITGESLRLAPMQEAARSLIGTHDFSSFMAAGSNISSTIRTINTIEIRQTLCPEYLPLEFTEFQIEINANGFLRYMVRNISALLKEVGCGRLSSRDATAIVKARDRAASPPTAPPWGLYLVKVYY